MVRLPPPLSFQRKTMLIKPVDAFILKLFDVESVLIMGETRLKFLTSPSYKMMEMLRKGGRSGGREEKKMFFWGGL